MDILDHLIPALVQILTGPHLLYLVVGVLIGLLVGLLPGLGGISGMALILPFIYGMEPGAALALMIGVSAVVNTSDTFPSVLLGIPGSSGSQATVMDGFPLARKGEAARALGAAFTSSLLGGVFGALMLTFAVFAARPIILSIGFGEQLLLVVLALTLIGMLTGASALKGLAACGLGLLVGSIGAATATAEYRMTFGTIYLSDGLPLVVMGLGLFAIPEILDVLRNQRTIAEAGNLGAGWVQGFKDTFRHHWIVVRCASIGSIVGALPGLGGTVIDWIAYGHVVQTSRDKSGFGKGDIRGVIGPEAANNAKEGGALIPTLLFGIPGSGTMALLLGGLVLIGITPGRSMVKENIDLTYLIVWSIALANIVGAGICLALARPVATLTTIRYTLIAPFMIVLVFFAAFQASRDWGDLVALAVTGVLGVYMKRFGWSRPALLIGFVLSTQLEAAFYRTVQVYGFDFLTRPISIGLVVLCALSAYAAWRNKSMIEERTGGEPASTPGLAPTGRQRFPQVMFAIVLVAFLAVLVFDIHDLRFLGNAFPLTVAAITTVLLALVFFNLLRPSPSPRVFSDADLGAASEEPGIRPMGYYMGLVLALLALSALVGFAVAAPLYVFLFIRYLAGARAVYAALGALGIGAVLALLGNLLVLEYPRGLLQTLVDIG